MQLMIEFASSRLFYNYVRIENKRNVITLCRFSFWQKKKFKFFEVSCLQLKLVSLLRIRETAAATLF